MTVIGGRLKCITEKSNLHYTRPIGSTPTSGVRPNWWWYPRRKRRGDAVGNMHGSAHAQFVSWRHKIQIGEKSLVERLGQCNFGIPRPLPTHCRHIQGGVEDHWSGCDHWGLGVTARMDAPGGAMHTRVIKCRLYHWKLRVTWSVHALSD